MSAVDDRLSGERRLDLQALRFDEEPKQPACVGWSLLFGLAHAGSGSAGYWRGLLACGYTCASAC